MSAVAPVPPTATPHLPGRKELQVSSYDRVASWLVSFLVVVGVCVLALFCMWLTRRLSIVHLPVPVDLIEYSGYGGRGDHAAGFGRDAELGEPGMEPGEEGGDASEPSMEASLAAVTQVVTSQAAALDSMLAAMPSNPASSAVSEGAGGNPVGGGTGVGWGKGKGIGDSRKPGPLGEGPEELIPPWERWEIRFATTGSQVYARQLDFFKIELGAIGGGKAEVDYAYNLAKGKPDHRTGKPDQEDRIYMTWRDTRGPIAAFDRELMQRAGVPTARRTILQFLSKDVEKMLGTLEFQSAKGRDPRTFLKTVFGVREVGGKYEFHVIEQRFRPAPRG